MTVTQLAQRSPQLLAIWLVAVIITVVMIIAYIMYTVASNKFNRPRMKNLGNMVAALAIVICFIVAIWTWQFFVLASRTVNISRDPSSLYVSRDNLLLNWTKADISGQPIGKPITGNLATDGAMTCFKSYTLGNDPTAYDGYKDYIATYRKGGAVKQFYEAPDQSIYSADDDLENQRKLSLAYYRFLYCTKTYYQEIVNGDANVIQEMTFLSAPTRANLIAKQSNCASTIPDTQACIDDKPPQTCAKNPCWVALNETIAAQCLLYDDHVYSRINANVNPRGALEAMDITGRSFGSVAGFQVRPPHA